MATIQEQINQLKVDKQTLVDNLVEKGVVATSDETFTTLVPKVKDIQGGIDINDYFETTYSGTSPTNWVKNNFVKRTPDLVIDDNVTSLGNFCSEFLYVPKIICNSNVTNMGYIYTGCAAKNIDASGLNTSKVTDMGYMFSGCSKLTSLDVSNFDTSKVTNMYSMFRECRSLTNLDIRNFDFSNVTSYSSMFTGVPANCLIIVKDDIAKTWITSKFTTLTNVKTVAELGE